MPVSCAPTLLSCIGKAVHVPGAARQRFVYQLLNSKPFNANLGETSKRGESRAWLLARQTALTVNALLC